MDNVIVFTTTRNRYVDPVCRLMIIKINAARMADNSPSLY